MATVRYTTINGRVIAEKRGGVRKLYRPDHLGSTIALYDNTQAKTDTWVYWPYGVVRTRTGSTPTPFQFVGVLGYFRDSSDRTYVRARTYRQTLGIWQTLDPIWPNGAPYLYCDESPLSKSDRFGLFCIRNGVIDDFDKAYCTRYCMARLQPLDKVLCIAHVHWEFIWPYYSSVTTYSRICVCGIPKGKPVSPNTQCYWQCMRQCALTILLTQVACNMSGLPSPEGIDLTSCDTYCTVKCSGASFIEAIMRALLWKTE